MPVDVPEHLVLGEEKGFERGHPLLMDPHLILARDGVRQENQALDQTVDVHLPVGHPTKPGVPSKVLHLVQVEAPGNKAAEGKVPLTQNQAVDPVSDTGPQHIQGLL